MKNSIHIPILFIILFVIGCTKDLQNRRVDTVQTDDYSTRINKLINSTNPRFFNGVVHISKGGETKYLKEYGYSNFEDKTPISVKDKFRIMSNSKQITAVLILKEVEKGNIDLYSPISKYLPDFKQDWTSEVNVHQLLNMSSGIVDLDEPLIFTPGNDYRYSNPGYGLLGRIIEKVTKQTYIEVANNLFQELGMYETYCYELGNMNQELINGYWLKDGQVELVDFTDFEFTIDSWKKFIPAGGIVSNVTDLNLWDTKLHSGKILNPEIYNLLITPSNKGPHAAFDNKMIGYAYGLRVDNLHPVNHLGHGGRGFGFASIKFHIPEHKINVIIWENLYSRGTDFLDADVIYHFENEIRKIVLDSNLVRTR